MLANYILYYSSSIQNTMSKILIFFLLILQTEKNKICINSLYIKSNCDVISFTRNFTKMSNELLSSDAFLNSDFETRVRIISERIKNSYQGLSEMSSDNFAEVVATVQRSFSKEGQLDEAMTEFFGYVERIDALHKQYKHYKIVDQLGGFQSPYHTSTLDDYFYVLGSHGAGGTQDILDKIYHIMVPSASDSLRMGVFELMAEQRKISHARNLCDTENSFFHQLNEVYDILFHIETMSYVAMAYTFMLLGKRNETSYKAEIQKIALAFANRIIKYLNVVQSVMKTASREMYRCDPSHHIRNETFIEFDHLFQKILVNELQVTPSKTCSASCSEINSNNIFRCYSSKSKANLYCPKRYCRGIIRNCSWVGTSTLCEFPKESPRRYQWIESENGRYGVKDSCLGTILKVEQSMSGLYRCDNCLCQCVEERADSTSLRAISLRPQHSNISNNMYFTATSFILIQVAQKNYRLWWMVVTGVRFVEKDRLIHIQIQQGELIKDAQINRSSTEWVELENFQYDESENAFYLVEESGTSRLEEGIDYAFIGSKQNVLLIDDVTGPVETLVTGVRFNHSLPQWPEVLNTSPIEIEIHISYFLYEAGKLDFKKFQSLWVTTKNMPNPPDWYNRHRMEIKLNFPDNPTKSYENYPSPESNFYIAFRQTDIWKDAGQTTIPLFDLQPITSPIRPLDGIGIIHRNNNGSGGFISLKIFTVNCSRHLRVIDRSDTIFHKTAPRDDLIKQTLEFYEKTYLN